MDFDQKLLLLQSQLSRRYVYTASVTSGETSSLATGLPAKPQETITRIQFNIYINQSNFLGSLQICAAILGGGNTKHTLEHAGETARLGKSAPR